MKPLAEANQQLVHTLIADGLGGRMQSGEVVEVWAFNQQAHAQRGPLQVWLSELNLAGAGRAAEFVRNQKYQKAGRPDRALAEVLLARGGVLDLTLLLITDGEQGLSGTPFDPLLNGALEDRRAQARATGRPIICRFGLTTGRFVSWSIHLAGEPFLWPENAVQARSSRAPVSSPALASTPTPLPIPTSATAPTNLAVAAEASAPDSPPPPPPAPPPPTPAAIEVFPEPATEPEPAPEAPAPPPTTTPPAPNVAHAPITAVGPTAASIRPASSTPQPFEPHTAPPLQPPAPESAPDRPPEVEGAVKAQSARTAAEPQPPPAASPGHSEPGGQPTAVDTPRSNLAAVTVPRRVLRLRWAYLIAGVALLGVGIGASVWLVARTRPRRGPSMISQALGH
ncbi:MAG: hypothetical protein FJ387_05880 [Verrucomicrobia bacterium]|nr:hypothetical protein [Verrucomicrobiota bacterium]